MYWVKTKHFFLGPVKWESIGSGRILQGKKSDSEDDGLG